MRKLMEVTILVTLAVLGCDDKETTKPAADVGQNEDQGASKEDSANQTDIPTYTPGDTTSEIAPLPVCPDEVALADSLPCDCYGTAVNDPTAQVPGCQTDVVCCPVAQGLKCEDYEHVEPEADVADTSVSDTAAQDTVMDVGQSEDTTPDLVNVPVCPFEVDLTSKVPCTCKGTLVEDVKVAMPDCTLKVVCCPKTGVKCE